MSHVAYMVMAMAAAIGFIWRIKLAHAVAASAAPDRRFVHVSVRCDRLVLGPPDVGHVVGMG